MDSCSGYRKDDPSSCQFFMRNCIAGHSLTKKDRQCILDGKKTPFHTFTGAKGKFVACLMYDPAKKSIVFSFDSDLLCPVCNKPLTKRKNCYSCSGWNPDGSGCSFVLWDTVFGHKLTASEAADLIKKGRTKLITGLKSKEGKTFDAALRLDKQSWQIKLIFSKKKEKTG